jgi:hypothetical protein
LSEFENEGAREQKTQGTRHNKWVEEGYVTKSLVICEFSLCSVGIGQYCKMKEAGHAVGMKNTNYILAKKLQGESLLGKRRREWVNSLPVIGSQRWST